MSADRRRHDEAPDELTDALEALPAPQRLAHQLMWSTLSSYALHNAETVQATQRSLRNAFRWIGLGFALAAVFLFALGGISYGLLSDIAGEPEQIQQSRYQATLQSCLDTDKRYSDFVKKLDQRIPPKGRHTAQYLQTLAFVKTINPVRACPSYARTATRLP